MKIYVRSTDIKYRKVLTITELPAPLIASYLEIELNPEVPEPSLAAIRRYVSKSIDAAVQILSKTKAFSVFGSEGTGVGTASEPYLLDYIFSNTLPTQYDEQGVWVVRPANKVWTIKIPYYGYSRDSYTKKLPSGVFLTVEKAQLISAHNAIRLHLSCLGYAEDLQFPTVEEAIDTLCDLITGKVNPWELIKIEELVLEGYQVLSAGADMVLLVKISELKGEVTGVHTSDN